MRRAIALLASLGLLISMLPATALASPSAAHSWIVTVRDGTDPEAAARSLTRAHGGEVKYVYEQALNGFAFRGSAAAADAMLRNPNVTRVEADAEVWLDDTQSGATWGLDRVDQRALPLDSSYTYNATGAGVTAYVIDSGINFTHAEFNDRNAPLDSTKDRAVPGIDLVDDGQNGDDCNGHGTHVSGTIGGLEYGVAKDIRLVSVRVFGCSGGSSWSTIILAIEWVITDHDATEPAVANMSLGGGANSSVDEAVQNMIADGVSTAVAAGNGNMVGREDDACKYSPARVPEAMTISATDKTDTKASWANYGSCVDWFAPGVGIKSAWYDSDTATKIISGTSMATPHTAGVAALYLQGNAAASPLQVRNAIHVNSTEGIVTSSRTANNDLLYSGFITGGGGGGTTPATGTLSGRVSDSTNADVATNGISGAKVTVANASFSTEATTASDGSYSIADVPTGSDYTVGVSAAGYESAQRTGVEITEGAKTTVDFSLTPSTAVETATFALSLTPSSTSEGNTWTAIVTVTATDSTNKPVDGVTVKGNWSDGATATGECVTTTTTDPDTGITVSGVCDIPLAGIHKKTPSVKFTVVSASDAAGLLTYDGDLNDWTIVTKP